MKYYLTILLTLPILASANGLGSLPADNIASAMSAAVDTTLEPQRAVALFTSNSNKLTPAAAAAISPLILRLRYVPSVRFTVEGHSDVRGSKNHNLLLSMQRATAVRDFMIENGVRPEKIDINAFGEVRAAINKKNSKELILDRRVDISTSTDDASAARSIAMIGEK